MAWCVCMINSLLTKLCLSHCTKKVNKTDAECIRTYWLHNVTPSSRSYEIFYENINCHISTYSKIQVFSLCCQSKRTMMYVFSVSGVNFKFRTICGANALCCLSKSSTLRNNTKIACFAIYFYKSNLLTVNYF